MKLLIITTCFSPENAVGSIRLTKFVKYLVRFGVDVTVISPELHDGTQIDDSLECIELDKVHRITIPQSALFSKLFLKKRNKLLSKKSATQYIQKSNQSNLINTCKSSIYRYLQFSYSILRNKDWSNQVVKYSKINFTVNEYDCIFTSYPSLSGPWSSIRLKKMKISKCIICDFRDPITYEHNTTLIIYKLNSIIQKNILNSADVITYISEGVGSTLGANDGDKYHLLSNGFDPDDRGPQNVISDSKKLIFCYVGSLYGGARDFSVFFKVISELKLANEIKIDDIEFIYAGKEGEVLKKQAALYELDSMIDDKGFVTRAESLRLQQISDVCLVSSWNTDKDKGIMTGKVFEYFTNLKPIVAVINGNRPGSELAKVIHKVKGGVVVETASKTIDADLLVLKGTILNFYHSKMKYGKIKHEYSESVNDYSLSEMTSKLFKLIKQN